MPVNFISLLVKERINNSKHLMTISGINILSYWLVNYIFEFFKYYFTAGICLILIKTYNFYRPYLYIFYIIYGPAMISFTYVLSFLFSNEFNAQNTIVLINFILGDLSSVIILMLRGLKSSKKTSRILQYILSLNPAFCFDFAFNILINKTLVYTFDFKKKDWIHFKDNIMLKDWRLLLPLIIYCSLECVIYTLIFFIIENRQYSFKKSSKDSIISETNDTNVKKEIESVNFFGDSFLPYEMKEMNDFVSINEKPLTKYENVAIRVKNLKKIYSTGFLKKRKIAINNLNFVIKPGECFGLLGLNGAGKTTTFKCITQEISPDNGEIYVFGKEINGNFNELNKTFGYCPQNDAIFENLTVYENLEFYARIKGIKRDLVKKIVLSMIKNMSLYEFKNKISGRLSGGNKRKLSVAISFLANPPIILLDEPSNGMDPEARRFMWSVIHKISTKGRKSSVILTTHSMEEAETLCKRMGIMVNGEFVCIGTADEIKEKYGYGFEANVRIKPFNQEQQIQLLRKYDLDINFKIDIKNIKNILNTLGKSNYIDELKFGRLGERIIKNININQSINIGVLLNWLFFVENALKFIKAGQNYFDEIILLEHIENNFLFKLKKGNNVKSIGFFFGLFESKKNEYNITEYSLQKTSLEQIFNKFAAYQGKNTDDKIIDSQNEKKGIFIDDNLFNKLIN
jgi:ATP-binding cassette subfamily A (ABC1) protein 3